MTSSPKRKNRKLIGASGLLAAAALFPGLISAQALTPAEAVADALAHSPQLRAARDDVRSANSALDAALAQSLPRLSAGASAVRGDNPVYVFGSLLQQGRFSSQNFAIPALNDPGYLTNLNGSLNLVLPVFTAFKLQHGRQLAHLGLTGSKIEEQAQMQQVRYRALAACLRVFLDRSLSAILNQRIASSDKEVADAQRLEKKGLVLGSDYYAAQTILGEMRSRLVEVQGDLAAARADLAALIGDSGKTPFLDGGLGRAVYAVPSEEELVHDALAARPMIQEAELAVKAAEIKRRGAQESLLPRLDTFASLQTNTPDFSSSPSNRMVGVQMSLPFGDPSYFFRKRQARAEEDSSRARKDAAEEAVRIEVSQSYEAYQAALQGLPILGQTVEQAKKSLELFRPLYREGRQSIMDVLRAEDASAQTQEGYSQSLYAAQLGYARLLLSAGKLDAPAVSAISADMASKP